MQVLSLNSAVNGSLPFTVSRNFDVYQGGISTTDLVISTGEILPACDLSGFSSPYPYLPNGKVISAERVLRQSILGETRALTYPLAADRGIGLEPEKSLFNYDALQVRMSVRPTLKEKVSNLVGSILSLGVFGGAGVFATSLLGTLGIASPVILPAALALGAGVAIWHIAENANQRKKNFDFDINSVLAKSLAGFGTNSALAKASYEPLAATVLNKLYRAYGSTLSKIDLENPVSRSIVMAALDSRSIQLDQGLREMLGIDIESVRLMTYGNRIRTILGADTDAHKRADAILSLFKNRGRVEGINIVSQNFEDLASVMEHYMTREENRAILGCLSRKDTQELVEAGLNLNKVGNYFSYRVNPTVAQSYDEFFAGVR